jgi:CBS domain-containing protein
MNTVRDILARKGTRVVTVRETDSALYAANIMNDNHIGCVVVLTPDAKRVAGILTERDILTRIVAATRDPRTTPSRDVMTREVFTASPETPLDDVREVMRDKRIRHVPVVDDQGLCGLVSIGDLNAFHSDQLAATVESLEMYISRA